MVHGPVDVDAIRELIGEVLPTLPSGAAEVKESHERAHPYPDAPQYDYDFLRLEIVPRAAGAVDVAIDVADGERVRGQGR
jgi:hypothetical protein